MLEIRNISKSLDHKEVISDFSITFEKGKIYSIIGPNGSGKTTLIHILSSVTSHDRGEIILNGKKFDPQSASRYVYTTLAGDRGLHWRCSARQNIEYFLGLRGLSKKETICRIKRNGHIFGNDFTELVNRRVETMSFGQKKKVSLFMSFISGADYLIFDEVTEGIDVNSREQIASLSKVMRDSGKTMIFATHDIPFANSVSDMAVLLNEGKLWKALSITSQTDLLSEYNSINLLDRSA